MANEREIELFINFIEGEIPAVERNLKKAKGACFLGTPIEELTHDELIACAVSGWETEQDALKENKRQRDFLLPMKLRQFKR